MDFNKLTDEEIVEHYKNSAEATAYLLEKYKNFVKAITRSYFLVGHDEEDLLQEGMIAVCKAIQTYNGRSSFKSFVYLCVKSRILTIIKSNNREKNIPLLNYISLSTFINGIDKTEIILSTDQDPETSYINKETEEEIILKIKNSLSDFEYKILGFYLQGYSYEQIATFTKKNVKSIDNAMQRIRKKVKAVFNAV
ncbi:MAG: sigma-70 family RNA polymerase sigma factor [Clostridia bacterium]|nr:sigma-70 family RNA polymerase sigma factor [Clostridia bacterium]